MVSSVSSLLSGYYGNLAAAGNAAEAVLSGTGSTTPTVTGVDPSLLSAYYHAKSGASTAAAASVTKAPTYASKAPTTAALTNSVLNGSRFVDPTTVKLTSTPGTSPTLASDYKDLFAVYQGLTALEGLAQRASGANLPVSEQASLQTTFARGLGEVQSFLGGQPFKNLTVADGAVELTAQSTAGVSKPSYSYTTGTLYSGDPAGVVPAYTGDVRFSLTATTAAGGSTVVDFDLADLGSTPRTLGNVAAYLNGKLADAGVATRFADIVTPGAPQTVQAGGKTITVGEAPDSYALQIRGVASETVSLSADSSTPAVYVAQTSGTTAATAAANSLAGDTAGSTADASEQIVKLDGDPGASGAARVFGKTLPADVTAVRATTTGPDGALYVLADVAGPTPDGQPIQGAGDVALLKYDSAGDLAYARTLGAAQTASGYGLALSADGTQIAITGSVTGALAGAGGATGSSSAAVGPAETDSFVSVYGAALGDESWTQRAGAGAGAGGASVATGVAFGADGTVYVTGNDKSASPAGLPVAQNAYLQSFTATAVTSLGKTAEVVASSDPVQLGEGAGGANTAAGVVTTSDGGVVTASVENGHAILRRYDGPLTSDLQPTAVLDLGSLGGGELGGLTLGADGSIVLAGSATGGDLSASAVTTGYGGGQQAFVATVSADLSPGSTQLSYLDTGGGDATATAVAFSGGRVYVAGAVSGAPNAATKGAAAQTGYALAVDPGTGEIDWSNRFSGADGQAAPAGIAVAASGASVLDRLGLPQGEISFATSQSLVSATSVRPGDQFFVRSGSGSPQAVTVAADDTLATLATKVNRALGFAGTASVVTATDGRSALKITPTALQSVEIEAGPPGADALAALGLTPGLVTANAVPTAAARAKSNTATPFALKLSSSLDISTTAGAQAAQAALTQALGTIKTAYSDLSSPPKSTTSAASSGTVPAYITAQIADYQLALSRLTGGS